MLLPPLRPPPVLRLFKFPEFRVNNNYDDDDDVPDDDAHDDDNSYDNGDAPTTPATLIMTAVTDDTDGCSGTMYWAATGLLLSLLCS